MNDETITRMSLEKAIGRKGDAFSSGPCGNLCWT